MVTMIRCHKLLDEIINNADPSKFIELERYNWGRRGCGIDFTSENTRDHVGIQFTEDGEGDYFTSDVPMFMNDFDDWRRRMEGCHCNNIMLHKHGRKEDLNELIVHAHAICRSRSWRCAIREVPQ